jgi:hypothetical protein
MDGPLDEILSTTTIVKVGMGQKGWSHLPLEGEWTHLVGEVSPCLGLWFLNPSACQVCLHCIVYHVISYSCLAFCLRNHIFSIFSLVCLEKNFCRYLKGMKEKACRCLGISEPLSLKTGLILPHMLGLDIFSFPHSMSLLLLSIFIFFQH